jgi:calcineurin-like phosphoesterase family protein
MTTWFTADTHFGHENIIKYCNRPFANVKAMDDLLILNWNSCVKPEDYIYHLGDFCMGDPRPYFERLNGHIRILPGSHDKELNKLPPMNIFPKIVTLNEVPKITLCHYAMRSWPLSHYASWHLYGHHHGKLEPYGLSFDVGVDCWNYAPISLEEVSAKMAHLQAIVDYRK